MEKIQNDSKNHRNLSSPSVDFAYFSGMVMIDTHPQWRPLTLLSTWVHLEIGWLALLTKGIDSETIVGTGSVQRIFSLSNL